MWNLNLCMTPFSKFVVLGLGGHENGFNGVTPFEVHLDPQAVACPFEPFPRPVYDATMKIFLLFEPLLLVSLGWLLVVVCPLWVLCFWLNLCCSLLTAHGRTLKAYRAFLMCSISLCRAC